MQWRSGKWEMRSENWAVREGASLLKERPPAAPAVSVLKDQPRNDG